MKTKRCPKCERVKCVSEFSKHKAEKGGLSCYCKLCMAEYGKKYREANREKIAAKARKQYRDNPEIAAKARAYYEANREKIAAKRKKYAMDNPEKMFARRKKWRESNREKIAKINRHYYYKNHKRQLAKDREYRNWRRANLTDSYVRSFLYSSCKIKKEDVTQEMIELKREQIKLFRELKKGRKVLNELY